MTAETIANIAVGVGVPLVVGAVTWAWRVEKHMTRMRTLMQVPQKINKLDRRTLLLLMKIDPIAAQNELRREGSSVHTV